MFSVDQTWIEDAVTSDLNNRLFGNVKGHNFSQKTPKRRDGAIAVNNTQSKDKVEHKGKLKKRKVGNTKDDHVLPKTRKLGEDDSSQTTCRQLMNSDTVHMKKKLKKIHRKKSQTIGAMKDGNNSKLQCTNFLVDVDEDCAKDKVKLKKKKIKKKRKALDQGSVELLNSANSENQTNCDVGLVRQKQTTEAFAASGLKSSSGKDVNMKSANGNRTQKKMPFAPGKLTATLKLKASYQSNDASEVEVGVPRLTSEKHIVHISPSRAKQGGLNLSTRDKMKSKLEAARFRYLNEQLYTSSSQQAVNLFREDPQAFDVYHAGFQSQVASWPVNPVDQIISDIKSRSPSLVVADFGCGEAKLARSVPNTVYSFDLVAVNKHVTVCDISKVPLGNNSVDIAVICLALMGNNWVDFVREAARVLKPKGLLKIVEVSSRFEDTRLFVKLLECLGFTLKHQNGPRVAFCGLKTVSKKQDHASLCVKSPAKHMITPTPLDNSNKMFISFEFVKRQTCNPTSLPQVSLLPCLYKKR